MCILFMIIRNLFFFFFLKCGVAVMSFYCKIIHFYCNCAGVNLIAI